MNTAISFRNPGPLFAAIVLGFSAFLVFFAGSAQGDIHNFDSLMLSTVARNVLDTGDWWTLYYPDRHTPWFDHPPLGIWGISAGFILFGVTTIGARLFSAACGFATTIIVGAIGWKLRGPWTGFLSGVALLATPYFVKHARRPRLDAPLALFIAAAVLGLLLSDKRRVGWVLFGLSTGLAILTKGIVGLAPLGIAPVALWWMGRWRWKSAGFWGGCLLAIAVPIPWLLLHSSSQGSAGVEPYFVDRIWGAILGAWPDPRGTFYYLWIGLFVGLPWFPVALYSLARLGVRRWREGPGDEIAVLVWALAILIPFSLVRHKHAYYMIPLLPPLAIATGMLLDGWLPLRFKQGLAQWLGIASLGAALALLIFPIPLQREKMQDLRGLSDLIRSTTSEGEVVHIYMMPPMRTEAALAFYAGRRTGTKFADPEQLRAAVAEGQVRFLYARDGDWTEVSASMGEGEVIGRAEKSVFVRFGGE
ncbi:MAG: glycosyltransferase family 39 protein [Planctomycetota bacterium]|nr:glycosyltransferase family 39 protein [Planctomycetota bacterium]